MNFYDVLLAKKIKENHDPRVESLSVTQNGRYEESNVVYSPVVVNVPQPQPVLKAKSITSNGTYNAADESADGYSSVVVDVPLPSNAYLLKYESGDVITVEDGAELPLVKCEAEIEPDQDLHGYDKPWIGGAGKNKLEVSSTYSFSNITNGVITDNGKDGVRFTGQKNSGGWGDIYFTGINLTLKASVTYVLSCGNVPNNVRAITLLSGNTSICYINTGASEATYTPSEDVSITQWRMTIADNSALTFDFVVYPMIRLSTESDSTFVPYTNICPISGRSEVNVERVGVNQWDEEWELGGIDVNTGEKTSTNQYIRSKNYIPVIGGKSYYFYNYELRMPACYDSNKSFIGSASADANQNLGWTLTMPSNAAYMLFDMNSAYGTTYNNDISINSTPTDTEYHQYQGKTYTISLGDNIYGGELDVTKGELRVTHVIKQFTSTDNSSWTKYGDDSVYYSVWLNDSFVPSNIGKAKETISNEYKGVEKAIDSFINGEYVFNVTGISSGYASICLKDERFTTASDFKASLTTPLQLVYPLATPTTIKLTPTQIEMLENTNTIYADSGELEILYWGK